MKAIVTILLVAVSFFFAAINGVLVAMDMARGGSPITIVCGVLAVVSVAIIARVTTPVEAHA